ncbi:MAG: hypothetical protein ACRD3T_21260 [Terriglobia bacterium]
MVAIRFKSPEERAEGFMALVRQGTVRTLRGEVFVFGESGLDVLDALNLAYERVPLDTTSDEVDALRNTPTVTL